MLTWKLSLIVIIGPFKLFTKEANWIRNIKYAVAFDLYSHDTRFGAYANICIIFNTKQYVYSYTMADNTIYLDRRANVDCSK